MSDTTQSTSNAPTLTGHTWVAVGPAGAVGSIHGVTGGYTFKMMTDDGYRGVFPTLEVAKAALYACMLPGSDLPEFHAH